MAGRIGARPSADPGVALLALATSSTPWPRNTTLRAPAEEKPAHARASSELQLLTPAKRPLLARPCRFGVILDRVSRFCLPADFRFALKADLKAGPAPSGSSRRS